jgi:hypothetical protein
VRHGYIPVTHGTWCTTPRNLPVVHRYSWCAMGICGLGGVGCPKLLVVHQNVMRHEYINYPWRITYRSAIGKFGRANFQKKIKVFDLLMVHHYCVPWVRAHAIFFKKNLTYPCAPQVLQYFFWTAFLVLWKNKENDNKSKNKILWDVVMLSDLLLGKITKLNFDIFCKKCYVSFI